MTDNAVNPVNGMTEDEHTMYVCMARLLRQELEALVQAVQVLLHEMQRKDTVPAPTVRPKKFAAQGFVWPGHKGMAYVDVIYKFAEGTGKTRYEYYIGSLNSTSPGHVAERIHKELWRSCRKDPKGFQDLVRTIRATIRWCENRTEGIHRHRGHCLAQPSHLAAAEWLEGEALAAGLLLMED